MIIDCKIQCGAKRHEEMSMRVNNLEGGASPAVYVPKGAVPIAPAPSFLDQAVSAIKQSAADVSSFVSNVFQPMPNPQIAAAVQPEGVSGDAVSQLALKLQQKWGAERTYRTLATLILKLRTGV